jgi:hypothetical protein
LVSTSREEIEVGLFEKKVADYSDLTERRNEGTKKLHSVELYNLYASRIVSRMNITGRIRWARPVVGTKLYSENLNAGYKMERLGIDGKTLLKFILKNSL